LKNSYMARGLIFAIPLLFLYVPTSMRYPIRPFSVSLDSLITQILKRFSQLTGHRVPDPLLNTVLRGNKPLIGLIDLLTQSAKPKPKKFAEVLLAKQKKAVDFATREKLLAEQGLQAHTETVVPTNEATKSNGIKQKPKFTPLGPNVMVFTRRETQVDREMEIGRWKVIKRELENRGLPVYPVPKLVPAGETWRKDEGGAVGQV
jgi:hypothetical protein